MSVKKKITGALLGSLMVAALSPTFAFAELPEDIKTSIQNKEDFTADGFDFEFEADSDKGSYISRTWKIVGQAATSSNTAIPDVSEGDGFYGPDSTYVRNTSVIEDNSIGENDKIRSLYIPSTLLSISGDAFFQLKNLEEFKVDSNDTHHIVEDGVLYLKPSSSSSDLYAIFPKGKVGDINISVNTVDLMEKLPFYKMDIGTLTLPASLNLEEYDLIGADVDSYAGATDDMVAIDGSLFSTDGTRLIAYGNTSTADLSKVTSVNPYAFFSQEILEGSNLPESLKKSVPFSFRSGEGEGYTGTRYFNIDGKTAYCYDHGKKNPVSVGEITDYNEAIDSKEVRDKITRLLCAGVPNDGLGIFEDIFGTEYDEKAFAETGDAAKNAVGGLVWELTDSGYTASAGDTYGTGHGIFEVSKVNEYIHTLREFAETGVYNGKSYSEDVEKNFQLGFYPAASDEYQGLIVLNEKYVPEPTPEEPEPTPDPTPDPEPEKPTTPATPSQPEKPEEEETPSTPSKGGTGGYSGWDGPSDPEPTPTPTPTPTPVNPTPVPEQTPTTPRGETTVPKTEDGMLRVAAMLGCVAIGMLTIPMIYKKRKRV